MTRIITFLALRIQSAGSDRRTRTVGAGGAASLGSPLRLTGAAILIWLSVIAVAPAAGAEDILTGPVPAVVEDVIDGDTLRVRARIWLGQDLAIYVRLAGVDAPEVRGSCVPAVRSSSPIGAMTTLPAGSVTGCCGCSAPLTIASTAAPSAARFSKARDSRPSAWSATR